MIRKFKRQRNSLSDDERNENKKRKHRKKSSLYSFSVITSYFLSNLEEISPLIALIEKKREFNPVDAFGLIQYAPIPS